MISKATKIQSVTIWRLDKKSLSLFICLVVLSFSALSKDFKPIEITDAYMPEIAPVSHIAAIYLTLTNRNGSPETLINLTSASARHVMIHETIEVDGLLKMQHLKQLEIGAQQTVKLSPGGKHVMLMGVKLKKNANSIELNLEFKSGNKQRIIVPIVKRSKRN